MEIKKVDAPEDDGPEKEAMDETPIQHHIPSADSNPEEIFDEDEVLSISNQQTTEMTEFDTSFTPLLPEYEESGSGSLEYS